MYLKTCVILKIKFIDFLLFKVSWPSFLLTSLEEILSSMYVMKQKMVSILFCLIQEIRSRSIGLCPHFCIKMKVAQSSKKSLSLAKTFQIGKKFGKKFQVLHANFECDRSDSIISF